ncbi:hypothetical protein [Streptomyces sp. DB-54]
MRPPTPTAMPARATASATARTRRRSPPRRAARSSAERRSCSRWPAARRSDTVTTGANPNHVTVAHGTAFVLAESGSGPAGQDELHRFRVTR